MVNWSCYRCLKTTGRANSSELCKACRAALADSGLAWCSRCKQAVPVSDWNARRNTCRLCHRHNNRMERRRRKGFTQEPPHGYIRLAVVARRIGYSSTWVTRRLKQGWLADVAVQVGAGWFLPDWETYPLWEAWKR